MYRNQGRVNQYRSAVVDHERTFLSIEGTTAATQPAPISLKEYGFDPKDPQSNQMKTLNLLQKTLEENVQLKSHIKALEMHAQNGGGLPGQNLATLTSQNAELLEKLTEERKISRNHQTENEELRRELHRATQSNQNLKIEVEETKKRINRLEVEAQAKIEEEVREIRQAHRSENHELITKMQNQERMWTEERKRIIEERDQYSIKYEAVKKEVMEARAEYKKAKEEKMILTENIDKLNAEIEILTKRINHLTTQNMIMAESNNQSGPSERVDSLQQEIRVLKQRLKDKSTGQAITTTQSDYAALLREKKEIETRLTAITKRLQLRESRVEQLEKDLGTRNEAFANLRHEMNHLRQQLDTSVAQRESLQDELKRAYQTIREIATSSSPIRTGADPHTREFNPDDPTIRGRPVPFSDYLQLRRENALLRTQLAEALRFKAPVASMGSMGSMGSLATATQSTARSSSAGAERSLANLGKEIEELMQSLPEIAVVNQTPVPQQRPKSGTTYSVRKKPS